VKGITYYDLVRHYGLEVCNLESGCVYSPSTHKRGKISHWRGDIMHWYMNRLVTRPGLLMFLRAIARDRIDEEIASAGVFTPWFKRIADECMWAQREAQEKWKVKIPKSAYKREKGWILNYWYTPMIIKGEMNIEEYTSPTYMWANTQEEGK
jgi:hypothetical protein